MGLPLLLLLGCRLATECQTVATEVDDDEADLGDLAFTPAEVLAAIEGLRRFPASTADGAVLATTLDLVRGEGPAEFPDAEFVETGRWESSLSADYMLIICLDSLEIPVLAALTTEDDTFAIEGDTLAVSQVWGDVTEGVGGISVDLGDGAALLSVSFADDALLRVFATDRADDTPSYPPEAR